MTTWYVDASATLGGNGSAGNPFQTIQAAVTAAAASGDTISVAAGTYNENVSVTKAVNIQGAGAGATIVNGNQAGGQLGTFVIQSSNVTINGFTILGLDGPAGIEKAAIYFPQPVNNVTITNNDIVARGDSAIDSDYNSAISNVTISHNTISGATFDPTQPLNHFTTYTNDQFGISNVPRVAVYFGSTNKSNIVFSDNDVTASSGSVDDQGHFRGNAAVVLDGTSNTATNNTFEGLNNVAGASDIDNAPSLRMRGTGHTATGNTIDGSVSGGIDSSSAANVIASNPTVVHTGDYFFAAPGNETFTGTAAVHDTIDMTFAGTHGSYVDLASTSTGGMAFSSDTGIDQLSGIEDVKGSAGTDVLLGSSADNTFIATAGQDQIDGRGGSDTFDASSATSAVQVDLTSGAVTGAYTATLTSIENVNTGAGNDTITLSSAANVVDAGAGVDTVMAGAAVDPAAVVAHGDHWTLNGTDTLKNVEVINDGTSHVLLVGAGGYATIQDAIDAAQTGDTIRIAAGDYHEHLTIAKSGLTIIADDGATLSGTFKSENGLQDSDSIADFLGNAPSYLNNSGKGIEISGSNVSISGLSIENFYNGIKLLNGANHVTLSDVDISGTEDGIFKGTTDAIDSLSVVGGSITDSYIGIYFAKTTDPLQKAAGNATNVLIDGTHFEGIEQKGIYVETLSDSQITNVTMTDVGQWGGGVNFGAFGNAGNGINLNLKNGDYANIEIDHFTLTDVGASDRDQTPGVLSSANGGAIVLEARNDGTTYGAAPATLSNVHVHDGSISGHLSSGITVGEPGKANADPDVTVDNVTINGAQHNAFFGELMNEGNTAVMTVTGTDAAENLVASGNSDGAFSIDGGAGNDTITTGSNNDTIHGGTGNDTIDGKVGLDTVTVDATYSPSAVSNSGATWTVDAGTDGTDTLTNVEKVVFSNGTSDVTTDDTSVWLVHDGTELTYALAHASNGDVIQLAAGQTFTGTFTVNDVAVTILGANHGVGIDGIRSSDESVIKGHLVVNGEHAVTIDGVELFADATTGTTTNTNAALQLHGTGTYVVKNSLFFSDFQGGNSETTAIVLGADAQGNVTIDNNTITGSQHSNWKFASWQRGIWSDGMTADLNITNNSFSWSRSGINIDSYNNDKVDVSHNHFVTDALLGDPVLTGIAIGIPVNQGQFTSIHDNDFSGADSDINLKNIGGGFTFSFDGTHNTSTEIAEVLGGSGGDNLTGSSGSDLISGDGTLPGETGYDALGLGADHIYGLGGNDYLFGQSGNDTIEGGDGNDSIDGGADDDQLIGGAGVDTIRGGDGNDSIDGGADNDSIDGGAGKDTILGGTGNDSITGGDDNDSITGGDGNDTVDGGAGTDTAVFLHNLNDYHISYNSGTGTYTVAYNGTDTDTVTNVEKFQFADQTVDVQANGSGALINASNPSFTSGASASFNEGTAGLLVYTANATDADSHATFGDVVYSLDGSDASLFTIDSATGAVTINAAADYETRVNYNLTIIATQGVTSSSKAVILNVNDLNDTNPVFTSPTTGNVNENAATSTVVYQAIATDKDTHFGAVTYSLGNQHDEGQFTIDAGTGEVRLKASANYEGQNSYTIVVNASQGDVAHGITSTPRTVTISVNNLNDNAPVFQNADTNPHVLEGTATSVAVFTASATDADNQGSIVYSLSGDDASLFNINSSTGAVTLKSEADFETTPVYHFKVDATQGTGDFATSSLDVTLTVDDRDEGIAGLGTVTLTAESGSTNTPIGQLDTDDSLTFDVTTLNAGTNGHVYLANGTELTASMTGLTLDQVNGLTYSSGTSGGGIGFTVHEGSNTGTQQVVLNVTNAVSKTYTGGSGANRIDGAGGDDTVKGAAGADTLLGGSGNDRLYGQTGHDTMTGGTGDDRFYFSDKVSSANSDFITDFTRGHDKIVVENSYFAVGSKVDSSEVWHNTTGKAHDGNDRFIYETDTGKLWYDKDGTGSAKGVLIATLEDTPGHHPSTLTSADFLVV